MNYSQASSSRPTGKGPAKRLRHGGFGLAALLMVLATLVQLASVPTASAVVSAPALKPNVVPALSQQPFTSGYQLPETYGGTNPLETCAGCESWGTNNDGTASPPDTSPSDLVNTATGDVNESYTFFSAPSLSNDFDYRLSYDAQQVSGYAGSGATYPGAYGWGWTSNYNASAINTTGGSHAQIAITEQSGAVVVFTQPTVGVCPSGQSLKTAAGSGASYCAAYRVNATFGEYGNYGVYALDEDGDLQNLSFTSYGVLFAAGTSVAPTYLTLNPSAPVNASNCPASGSVSTCVVVTDTVTGRFISTGISPFGAALYTLDPNSNMWLYGYNATHELTSITDPNGHAWGFGYDTAATGQYVYGLTSIIDPDGHATSLTYDHAVDSTEGMVTSVTDGTSPAHTTSYAYPSNTCGTCVTGTQNTTVTDASGNVEKDQYYYLMPYGNQVMTNSNLSSPYYTSPNTTVIEYLFSPIQQTEYILEPSGTFVTDITDPIGNLWSEDIQSSYGAPGGSTTNYAYNSFNEQCWQALPNITVTNNNCATPPTGASVNTYDTFGKLLSSATPLGNTTHFGYSAAPLEQLCWKTLPDQSPGSAPTCAVPPAAAATYTYNTSNELTATTTPDGTASGGYSHNETSFTYNGYGEVLTSISPNGYATGNYAANTTNNTYDTGGRLRQVTSPYTSTTQKTTMVTLDAAGNVLTKTDPNGLVTTSAYDADNRMCWTAPPGVTITVPPQSCTAPPTGSTAYQYRADTTDQTLVTDANGYKTATNYLNPFFPDSPTTVTDATNDITSDVYDLEGNLCVTGAESTPLYTAANANDPGCAWSSGYTYDTYDQFNNVKLSTNPDDNTTTYYYNQQAYPTLPTSTIAPSPQGTTTDAYDADGQLIEEVNGHGDYITAAYTTAGNVCWRAPIYVANPSCASPQSVAGTSDYNYNAAEELYFMADIGAGSTISYTSYTHDPQGQLLQENNNSGLVNYTYDPGGDNLCVSYPIAGNTPNCAGTPSSTNTVVDYTYDPGARMTSETPWNGASLDFGYNARSDMTSITNYPSNILLGSDASESIAYDPADNPMSETVTGQTGLPAPLVGPQFSDTFTSNPDELYQTQSTTIPTTIPATTINNSYTYSAKHQDLLAGQDTYVNSPGGEVASDTPAGKSVIANTYNGASELTKSVNPNTGVTTNFAYDTDGNRCVSTPSATTPSCATPPAGSSTYGWNSYNQLCWSSTGTAAAGDGTCYAAPSGASTYTYDGTGLRVNDTAGGSSQNFVYDTATRAGQPLMMMDGTNAYIYGPANFGSGTAPLEQIPLNLSILPSYLFSDPNGVRSMMTTVTVPVVGTVGVANGSWTYGTYGARTPVGLNLLGTTPFGFQGGYTDPSGLIYFVARYYDPSTQQWMSVDPDVAATGQPYAFTGADPINAMDPLGNFVCESGGTCGTPKYFENHPSSSGTSEYQSLLSAAVVRAYVHDYPGIRGANWVANHQGELYAGLIGFPLILGAAGISCALGVCEALAGAGALEGPALVEDLNADEQATIGDVLSNPDRMGHIFDNPGHFLAPLVEQYGEEGLIARVTVGLRSLSPLLPLSGSFGRLPITIDGNLIIVTGAVVNGAVRISNVWAPQGQ
jgi:RHS repeat-associated protein